MCYFLCDVRLTWRQLYTILGTSEELYDILSIILKIKFHVIILARFLTLREGKYLKTQCYFRLLVHININTKPHHMLERVLIWTLRGLSSNPVSS